MKFFYFIVRVSFYSPSGVCYNIAVKIYGDYHTHTYFSDGRRSVRENVEAAIKRGLNAVAISDHGFSNPDRYSLTHKKASEQRLLIAEERSKHPEIAVFHAIEADILGLEGNIDMRPEDFENFDFVIAGFHRFATPRRPADFFTFYLPAYFSFAVKPSRDTIRRNTRAFTRMIKRYPVAIVAAVAGVAFLIYNIVRLARAKEWGKAERNLLRRTVLPLFGAVFALIAASFAGDGVLFVLLAWIFLFMAAADAVGEFTARPDGAGKASRVIAWVGFGLLAAMFVLYFVFAAGLPVASGIIAYLFG